MPTDAKNRKAKGVVTKEKLFAKSNRVALREGTNVIIEFNREGPDNLHWIWDEFETSMLFTFISEGRMREHITEVKEWKRTETAKVKKHDITFEL